MKTAKRPKCQHRLDESLLIDVPPFSKLETRDIREILDLASCKRYDAGVAIFDEGAQADRFFMLLDGYVRVVRITPEGEQVIARHIPSGQLLGIATAVGKTHYPATAITAVESLALSWPTRLWDQFVVNYDGFATETYKTVGKRMGEVNTRIVEMATQQVEQRIANAVLRLINQTGCKVDVNGSPFAIRMPWLRFAPLDRDDEKQLDIKRLNIQIIFLTGI